MREKKNRIPLGGIVQGATPHALAELLKAKGFTSSASPAEAFPQPDATESGINLAQQGKIVLRRERKGHGGKTVTLITGLTLPAPSLDALARSLRKGLGCGATVEQGTIALQGDIVERAQDWLTKHGATKVVG